MNKSSNKIKDKYFYGIGSLIAKRLGLSESYVRNVLNGKFPNRKTKSTRKINALAKELMKEKTLND
ncbi:hypothetical protein [Aquimarina longa]|uniref:hypothetical protein n=1 Tax=Aquimarina longa TaxID=1080221 RepID=UPI0007810145|nr:hypothetical protein [Aquimarina longa]